MKEWTPNSAKSGQCTGLANSRQTSFSGVVHAKFPRHIETKGFIKIHFLEDKVSSNRFADWLTEDGGRSPPVLEPDFNLLGLDV